MKIVILGAGVVGTAAAYYLGRDGHEVVVVDRQKDVAVETSWGNAGLVSPGDSTSWASPAALRTFVKALFRKDLGIKVRPTLDPHFFTWSLRFLMQCSRKRADANSALKLRLALHSRECINALQQHTGIRYADLRKGILYFFRTPESLEAGIKHMRFISEHGIAFEVVDPNRVVELDPGLAAAKDQIAGALYSPMDQTGDSNLFSRNLAQWCREHLNVTFQLDTLIEGLDIEANRVRAIKTSRGLIPCDAAVLSMGAEGALLSRKIGVHLPIYPVKGYSATIPIDDDKGPTLGGADEDRLVAYSRLGNRLRVASTAEFAGYDRSWTRENFNSIFKTAHDLFPGVIDESKAQLWAGLRPMMPASVPVHGKAKYDNLYLDTGHGHVGWTMACGSGQFLSDLIAGRKTEIDPTGLLYA
ncbi:D-amino acid dehydrogenase [Methylovirgula sp. 4M-Z18]|uniref:D-amino acid dehydrogenase n=1 Tax=Methylovirgula sp. 4M-Z18 TaxID=2293567 RepID=UPI000E2F11DE|nr:D-amino acid dehydrogenase [Methylovirgula sp. 4M-Z18]RFB79981.1 D-amino acid dehydrogenase [Methylovirgula sp. 4M-Z18]